MTVMRRGYVDIPDGQIHYRLKPGRGTPIVCLHQTASSSAMFEKLAAAYAGEHPIYALDTPGFGGSFDPRDMPDMAGYGRYLSTALHSLGLERVHLFGHHTGASIGVEMAVANPGQIASLSMIGPVVTTADERRYFASVYPKKFEPQDDGSHLDRMWAYIGEIGARDLDLRHRELVDTARAWQGHIKVYTSIWEQDFGALYKQVRCPLLIMCSEADVLWPLFERAKEMRPDARAVVIPGSNFQTDEAPQATAEALRDFIEKL